MPPLPRARGREYLEPLALCNKRQGPAFQQNEGNFPPKGSLDVQPRKGHMSTTVHPFGCPISVYTFLPIPTLPFKKEVSAWPNASIHYLTKKYNYPLPQRAMTLSLFIYHIHLQFRIMSVFPLVLRDLISGLCNLWAQLYS